ncbi:hypothetical protein JXO59_10220 [candidate division KSB1 bacterium]|nr:hypothetical protein [candidate division KSB1 bacterium]
MNRAKMMLLLIFAFMSGLVSQRTCAQEVAATMDTAAGSSSEIIPDATLTAQSTALSHVLAYQGYLTDAAGNPITGTVQANVGIWSAVSGGSRLWQEDLNIDVDKGAFTAELGRLTPIARTLFDGSDRWIELTLNGETLSPRKQVLLTPMSLYTVNAGMLGNNSVDQFYLRSQADDATKNNIDAAHLGGKKADVYYDRYQIDAGYVPRNGINTVTSDMITDGSIQRQDVGFSLGMGTITAVNAGPALAGGGMTGEVTLTLAPEYYNGQAYDSRFVRREETNSVGGAMIREETITSTNIKNNSLQIVDMGFPVGTITQISTGTGLTGGGTTGSLTIALDNNYQSGIAYDNRFVRKDEAGVITSAMIKDGEITSMDIKNNSILQEDMGFSLGDITAVFTTGGIIGGGATGELNLQLEPGYRDGSSYDTRFVRRDETNAITSNMIKDGTIAAIDLAFPAGDITAVFGSHGITPVAGGLSGDVTLRLEESYYTGAAYDSRFPNKNTPNSVSGYMIAEGGVGPTDIADNALQSRHFPNPLSVDKANANGAVIKVNNLAISDYSCGIEGNGYRYGVRGVSSVTGLLGQGNLYGVHARLGPTPSPSAYALYVEGRAFCTNGGWGDVAENVIGDDDIEAGDVVVVDENGKYRVKKCAKPYDTRVAGIISTKPTIIVGTLIVGGHPLALSGIVPCKVTAANGPIRPGDLLTTSDAPGYAMKASEPKTGAIIGKALEGWTSGEGKIQVLVGLQ